MNIATQPDSKTAPVEDVAAHYTANYTELKAVDSWLYWAKRRLGQAVKDLGPIKTPTGIVSLEANGYDYSDPRIVEEFPALGVHVVTITVDTKEKAERALSLVCEEIPDAEVDHATKANGKAVDSLIKQRGDAAKRLMDLCPSKGKLTVK